MKTAHPHPQAGLPGESLVTSLLSVLPRAIGAVARILSPPAQSPSRRHKSHLGCLGTGHQRHRGDWGGTETQPLAPVQLLPLLLLDSSVRRALPASRSHRTVSPERKEATMWAGSVLVKATEVGIP